MLNRWSVLMLLAGALAGYTVAGPALQAQAEPLPFATGDTVMLWYGHDAAQSSHRRSPLQQAGR